MKNEREQHQFRERNKLLAYFAFCGIKRVLKMKLGIILILSYFAGMYAMPYIIHAASETSSEMFGAMIADLYAMVAILTELIISSLLLTILGMPRKYCQVRYRLRKVKLKNDMLESPMYIACEKGKSNCYRLYFRGNGITIDDWNASIASVESALQVTALSVEATSDNGVVCLTCAEGYGALNETILWHNECTEKDESIIVLGVDAAGEKVTTDLDSVPHILIGGATGSGKTIELKCLLAQTILKGAEMLLIDRKGGIDYGSAWSSRVHLAVEIDDILDALKEIKTRLIERQQLLRDAEFCNISNYNCSVISRKMHRIIIGIDELAELTDTTGLNKAEKEKCTEILSILQTIARLGRAVGIHLVMATQRPDANVVPGQIKNNVGCKLCGRADDVLSRMILDNTEAAERIPQNAQGLFVTNEHKLIKGFFFNNKMLDVISEENTI